MVNLGQIIMTGMSQNPELTQKLNSIFFAVRISCINKNKESCNTIDPKNSIYVVVVVNCRRRVSAFPGRKILFRFESDIQKHTVYFSKLMPAKFTWHHEQEFFDYLKPVPIKEVNELKINSEIKDPLNEDRVNFKFRSNCEDIERGLSKEIYLKEN